MNKISLFTLAFLIFSFQNLINGQNRVEYFKVYPVIANDIPSWAQAMYADDPNVFQVQDARDQYIKEFGFEKTIHTQNFKHWIRQVRDHVTDSGLIRPENRSERKTRIAALKNKRSQINKQAENWIPLGPFETYIQGTTEPYSLQTNVYSIDGYEKDPSILICGSETGTVFYTNDKGINWQTISDHAPFAGGVTAVKIHPDNLQHFFIGSDSRIYETNDGGASWTENFFLDGSANEFVFNPDNSNHIYCSASSGLFESQDGGSSWTKVQTAFCYDVVFHPTNPEIIYALVRNQTLNRCDLLKSIDQGASWTLKADGWYVPEDAANASVNGGKIGVTPADPQRIYVCLIGASKMDDNGWIGVYRSDNEAELWYNPVGQDGGPYNDINSTPWNVAAYSSGYHQGYYNFDLEVSPTDPDLMWIGTIRLSESNDGGYNFKAIGAANSIRLNNQHADIQDIEIIGDDIWVASDGGINYSNNHLNTCSSRKNGVNGADFWGFGSGWNQDILVGGKYHNGNSAYFETYDHGVFHNVGGVEESTGYVHPMDSRKTFFNKYWAGGTETVIIPDELGGSARYQGIFPYIPNESYSESWSSGFFFDPRYADHMYMGEGSKVWKSVNGGNYFEALHDFGVDKRVLEISISRANPDVMYTVIGGPGYWDQSQMYRSEDGGANWIEMTSLGTSTWRVNLCLNPENESEVWAATTAGANGNKVFQSLDKGVTWINKTTAQLDGERIRDMIYQGGSDGVVYIASQYSIFRFDPATSEWINISGGLPFVSKGFEMRPFYRDQKLRIATYGKGIWEVPFEVYSKPMAQPMTHVKEVYCSRDTVQFDCHSILDHTDAQWAWQFNPEPLYVSDPDSRNPKVVFGTNGAYDVTLAVTDKNGTRSEKTIQSMVEVINYCEMDKVPGLAMKTYETGDYGQTADFNREVSEFTVSAWVKPDGIQGEYTGIFMNDGPAGGFNFKNTNNTLAYHWPGGAWWWESGLTVAPNVWSHVALVINPTSATLYVNGVASVHNVGLNPLQLGTCKMGSYQGWESRNYRGMIDEVAVWDRALSTEEIRKYRHLTKEDFKADPNLIAYYQFNAPVLKVMDRVSSNHADLSRSAEKIESDGPYGYGSASKQTINSPGEYNYEEQEIAFTFDDVSLPEGDVYLSKINLEPNILPDENTGSAAYWIINNYGTRQVWDATELMTITPTDRAPNGREIDNPSLVHLYGRPVNDGTDAWIEYCNPFEADDTQYHFDASCQVRIEGQLYYTSEDAEPTSTEEEELNSNRLFPVVYPNPASAKDKIIVRNNQSFNYQINIYNSEGTFISKKEIPRLSNTHINTDDLPSGIYFYTLKNEKYYTGGKIVIE